MYYRLYPFTAKLSAFFMGRRSVETAAKQVEVLCSEEKSLRPPCIFLKDDLEKIVRIQEETSYEQEMLRLNGGEVVHSPTVRYIFKNVLAYSNGFSLPGQSFYRCGALKAKNILIGDIKKLDKASFSLSPISIKYFGHWLNDACPTTLLAPNDHAIILPTPQNWPHAQQYNFLFAMQPEVGDLFFVRELHAYQDYSQNSNKADRYQIMRQMIRGKVKPQNNRFVYLTRGQLGVKRSIINEQELVTFLQKKGFVIVEPEKLTVQKVMEICLGAEMVISMEGSQLSHGCYALRDNGVILALMPADRFNNLYADYAISMGLRYAFSIVEGSQSDGYTVNLDRLVKVMDKCLDYATL